MAGQIFWLFCTQFVAGLLALLSMVPIDVVGRSFYKINLRTAYWSAILSLFVWFVGLGRSWLLAGQTPVLDVYQLGAVVCTGLSIAAVHKTINIVSGKSYLECYGWLKASAAFAGLALALLIAQQVLSTTNTPTILRLLAVPGLACGAGLMGSVTLSMILGHYYLNSPKLPIEPLQTYNLALLWCAGLRALIFVVGLTICAMIEIPTDDPERGFFLENTILLTQRGLFGVIGPCLLAWMSWDTAKIGEPHEAKVQATQSATGILYGNMVLIAIGELVALYFQTSQGIAI